MILKAMLSMILLTSLISIGILWIIDMNKTYRQQVIKTSIFLLSVATLSVCLLSIFVLFF